MLLRSLAGAALIRRAAGLTLSIVGGLAAAGLLLGLAAGRPAYAGGSTIVVNPGGSIQTALNGANPGDTVQLNPGTYTESLTLSTAVNLVGTNAATTIIQAQPGQRVITVTGAAVNANVLIAHLTLQGGDVDGGTDCPQYCGGGMLITETAQPQLQNLVWRNNAAGQGGGLYAAASLTVTGGLFTNNRSDGFGGGVNIESSGGPGGYRLVLSSTQFISNAAGSWGGGAFVFGTALVHNGWFERNQCGSGCYGGGLISQYLTMTNTSFYTNTSVTGGGGAYSTVYAEVTGGVFQGNISFGTGGGLEVRTEGHVTGTQFISNSAQTRGGGLHLSLGSLADVSSVSGARFERNGCTAGGCTGGAIGSSSYFNLVVAETDFLTNTAKGNGGAIQTGAKLTMTNSLLRGNTCSEAGCRGGGVLSNAAYHSGVSYLSNTSQGGGGGAYFPGGATFLDTVLQGNRCLEANCRGGGVLAENNLTLTNTQLINNTSVGAGGGVAQLGAGDLRVVNSLFARNAAGAPGLALWFASPGSGVVLHTTFANAVTTSGAAVVVENGSLGLTNTIVTSYSVGISVTSGSAYEDYTLFFGVATPTTVGVTSGGGNHPTTNPLFANPAADNYHLLADSPAQDVGVNVGVPSDFDGDARPLDLGFDLGYDEFALVRLFLPLVVR